MSAAALAAAPLAACAGLHAPGALVALALLYTLLGLSAWSGARCLVRIPLAGRALGAALLGGLLFWQLREHGDWLHVSTRPLATTGALAGCLVAAAVALGRPQHAPRGLCATALGALAVALVFCDRADAELHWHLRAHHRLFASVLHRVVDAPVAPVEALYADGPALRRAPLPSAVPPAPVRPGHVVLVLVDTLRADALGSYGARPSPTPRLDRRAAGGVRFTDLRANAPWTSPSVASMLTGHLPEETGLYELGDPLPSEATTAAEVFRAWGYATAAFVANAAVAGSLGFDQGFDLYREVPATGAYPRADRVVDEVRDWLAARPQPSPPLFLYVHLMDPHLPYLSGDAPPPTAPEHSRTAYARELAFLDGELERLFAALETTLPGKGRWILTSDHGEEFGEHGGWGHGHSLHAELLSVPLLLLGAEAGVALDARLEGRDVFDLLLAAAETDEVFSARAWARGRSRALRYASSYATPDSWRALRLLRPYAARRLRGVERPGASFVWSAFGDTRALFDTERDPGERRNAIDARPELARELAASLDRPLAYVALPRRGESNAELAARLAALGYVQ